jgi:hypothetical protein
MSKLQFYDASEGERYPLWDRLFSHSIRPDGAAGMLIPYHDYLESTGDPEEDARCRRLVEEIAVVPDRSQIMSFSHVGEHASHDIALSTLVRCLEAVRKVREHGIASGPWEQREEWLNAQIHRVWQERGAFAARNKHGAGAAGRRYGQAGR